MVLCSYSTKSPAGDLRVTVGCADEWACGSRKGSPLTFTSVCMTLLSTSELNSSLVSCVEVLLVVHCEVVSKSLLRSKGTCFSRPAASAMSSLTSILLSIYPNWRIAPSLSSDSSKLYSSSQMDSSPSETNGSHKYSRYSSAKFLWQSAAQLNPDCS